MSIQKFTNIPNIRSNLTFEPQKPKNPHVKAAIFNNSSESFHIDNYQKVLPSQTECRSFQSSNMLKKQLKIQCQSRLDWQLSVKCRTVSWLKVLSKSLRSYSEQLFKH